jgi:outer membrane protein OmpA-like peptidoglycan-associated protein
MKDLSPLSLAGFLLILGILAPQSGLAQGFDLQQFNPMPNPGANFFGTSSAEVPAHMGWSAAMMVNYANNPLVRRFDGEPIERLVGRQATTHLLVSLGLLDRLELGLDVPVMMLQQGTAIPGSGISPEQGGFGIGDMRLVPKVQIFSNREHPDSEGVAVAFLLDTFVPSGNGEQLQGGDFRIGPRVAIDAIVEGTRLGANLGYQYRDQTIIENLQVRDTLSWNLGLEVPVADDLRLTAEAFGRLTPGAEEIRRTESPTELLAGGKYQVGNLLLMAGGGAGIIRGYGTPDFRAFAGVGWATMPPPVLAAPETAPIPEPQCRVATLKDDCTDIPPTSCEDGALRTYQAACEDGECSYRSSEKRCAEGTVCGQQDDEAACVVPPECAGDDDCTSLPGPTCAEGILTTFAGRCVDQGCEYDPVETSCGEEQECGLDAGQPACVEKPDLVEVDEKSAQIQIMEIVLFEVDSARIDARSYKLLNQVASVLYNNSHLNKVRIEGHTDNSGSRDYNLELSQERAASVRAYLIAQGVEAERLSAEGLGPDQPRETNKTAKGRAANRRVEFHIVERN